MKSLATVVGACLIGACGGYYTVEQGAVHLASIETPVSLPAPVFERPEDRHTPAGDYLSSLFAQRHHDWKQAEVYLNRVMDAAPENSALIRRSMVLAMGGGNVTTALSLAKQIAGDKDPNALAELFLAVGAFHDKDYKAAAGYIDSIKPGSLSDFVMPLLKGWAAAGNGELEVSGLSDNVIHIEHAVMIADMLKQPLNAEALLDRLATSPNLTSEDYDRMAKLYIHIGKKDKAADFYKKILEKWPGYPGASEMLGLLEKGEPVTAIATIRSADEGVAATLYDMASLLFHEYADDSARVFCEMALYLTPGMTNAHLLLALIDTRAERYAEAIESYDSIASQDPYYLEARRQAAALLEQTGQIDAAIAQLNALVKEKGDLDSLIQIGDIYRKKEDFPKAIEIYNVAATKLGGAIPKEYWNLLYVRGISYERAGQWDKAEADLKATVAYAPNQPFVLNYLGYAWADQGIHLDEALDLVKRAAAEQPEDGYIADSLGWILYRRGQFGEALAQLEKAIELLPYDPVVNDHLGDAYWQAGRKREARFQWERAKNYSHDDTLIAKLNGKLDTGLAALPAVREARSQTATISTGQNGQTAIP